jgi:DNA polymerase-3 subunit epsilon
MRVYVADTETSGLGKDARVVEYAHILCKLENNRLVETGRFESLVNPGIPIPTEATKVHGITDEMVKGAPCISDILPAALGLTKNEHATVLGHNFVGFDMTLLDGVYPKSLDIGCSLKAARVFIDSPRHSLDFLREHLKLGESLAHSALGDCLTTLRLINRMLEVHAWEAVSSCMLQRPTKMPFGKHKGSALGDLPDSYVRWLLEDCDSLGWDLRRALVEL